MTGSLSVSFSFSRYYGGVIKQYRFLQVFIGNMMVLQIFCIKIKKVKTILLSGGNKEKNLRKPIRYGKSFGGFIV